MSWGEDNDDNETASEPDGGGGNEPDDDGHGGDNSGGDSEPDPGPAFHVTLPSIDTALDLGTSSIPGIPDLDAQTGYQGIGTAADSQAMENEGIAESASADAADEAGAFNDSLLGTVAGWLGFSQKASNLAPGVVDTVFSFNPLNAALGLFAPPGVGLAASAFGVGKRLGVDDIEVAAFRGAGTPQIGAGWGAPGVGGSGAGGGGGGSYGAAYAGLDEFYGVTGGGSYGDAFETVDPPAFDEPAGAFDGNAAVRGYGLSEPAPAGRSEADNTAGLLMAAAVAVEVLG